MSTARRSTGAVPCKLSAIEETLNQALTADARLTPSETPHRPCAVRRDLGAGYTVGYSRVTNFRSVAT
jgi:hypothetical protein